ncbi:unnamed protein product [Oncorhynchus mykiss]|uniref:Uncharacterized protein n=1 Tax=Oncorhynchus mykiss TaxID=8022 RepID=A0A060X726_ONCMY|nr:unnamed protein product [Oncorhynchus mykiss]
MFQLNREKVENKTTVRGNMALGSVRCCIRKLLHDCPSKGLLCGRIQSDCMACRVGGHYLEVFNRKLKKNELILKDGLKLLLHLCQSAEDMVTARGAIYRYHEENSNVAFGEFKFGPPFMRLCYELGLEEMSAATRTDKSDVEKAQSMFGQIMSTDSRICQNLKVLMLAMAGAVKESLSVLTLALGSSSPAFIKKPEFAQEVVDLVRLRSEDSPLASVEQAVSHLQQAGQVTQRNLDKMLCHTPMGTKRMPMGIMDERRISQRTLRPLQSTLLSG